MKREAEAEGLSEIFKAAGAEWREAGCSMCIAMNGDQLQPGQYAVSTSNRNFEGRQGKGGRTFLASPLTAAASAIAGVVADPRRLPGIETPRRRRGPLSVAEPFTVFTSTVVPLPAENVDTDQIVPARYLKVTDKAGLAEALFRDWRFEEDGSLKEPRFILDQPGMAGRKILLVGDNFGAGSSREHAPWALAAWGVRAILSTSYADIFRSNSLKNGVLPIVVDRATHERLFELARGRPGRRADGRPGRAGRPPAGRHDDRLRYRPVRQADDPGRHGRARLPPREGGRDGGLGGGPPAADRYARGSALTDP